MLDIGRESRVPDWRYGYRHGDPRALHAPPAEGERPWPGRDGDELPADAADLSY